MELHGQAKPDQDLIRLQADRYRADAVVTAYFKWLTELTDQADKAIRYNRETELFEPVVSAKQREEFDRVMAELNEYRKRRYPLLQFC